jgi:hypothetical protein
MKKLSIVLSLLAFMASTLIAQNDIPRISKMGPQIIKYDTFSEQYLTSEREHKFNYYDETEIEDIHMSVILYSDNSFRMDSILYYDDNGDMWLKYEPFYDDPNGNITLWICSIWNTDDYWDEYWKREYTYDSNGNLTSYARIGFDTNIHDWKHEYTYDSNGNLTLEIYSLKDTDLNYWYKDHKDMYTYDSNGNLTLSIRSNWGNNDWEILGEDEYTYDSNGNLTLHVHSDWNDELNDWELRWKNDYTYDSNGNLTLEIYSNWNNELNDWELRWKSEYTYASNGNPSLRVSFDWNTGFYEWEVNSKSEYTYDSNGNLTFEIYSDWNDELNDWEFLGEDEYTYDSNGNLTLKIDYEYMKDEYTYDSNGNRSLRVKFDWNTDLNDWELRYTSEWYWSQISEVGELNINDIFTVFPNPTSGNLSIKGEVFLNQHVILEMTNLRGQSVYSNKLLLTNIDHNIILPKLPKGMYLLTIKANNINSTQKIFIE